MTGKRRRSPRRKQTEETDPPVDNVSTSTDYSKLKVPELKTMLRDKGLPTAGRKAELIQRLEDNEDNMDIDESSKNKEEEKETSASPPRKRRKLERKGTVELEQPKEEEKTEKKTKVIERKTTSFLEQTETKESVSILSSKSKSRLMSRLSSILSPESILGKKN